MGFLLVIATAGAAIATASAGHRAPSSAPDGLAAQLDTKLTHIDTDGDGQVDLVRAYDSQGRLTRRESTIAGTPPMVETYELTYGDHPVTTRKLSVAGKLVHLETERYAQGGERLIERETLLSSKGDGVLDERRLETYGAGKAHIEKYTKRGAEWKETGRDTASAITMTPSAELTQYVDCMQARQPAGFDRGACERALANPLGLAELDPQIYAQLTCRAGNDVFTPSGFRIDVSSCASDANASEAMQNALATVAGPMLSCLNTVNPRFAAQYVAKLDRDRPRLRCTQSLGEQAATNEVCAGGSTTEQASCQSETPGLIRRSDAFYYDGQPKTIYVTGADPSRIENRAVPRGAQNPNAATLPMRSEYSGRLASTIFHEGLHACGHPGGHHHNDPNFGDEVYGCEALCGGSDSAWRITYEGCTACLTTAGNGAQASVARSQCARFPKAAVIQKLWAVEEAAVVLYQCYDTRHNDAYGCPGRLANLRLSPSFSGICPPPGPAGENETQHTNRCLIDLRRRVLELVEEGKAAAAHGGDARDFGRAVDFFLASGRHTQSLAPRRANGALTLPDDSTMILMGGETPESQMQRLAQSIHDRKNALGFLLDGGLCAEIENQPSMTDSALRSRRAALARGFPYHTSAGIVLREAEQGEAPPTVSQVRTSGPCRNAGLGAAWERFGQLMLTRGGGG